jgi:hypothetical protein
MDFDKMTSLVSRVFFVAAFALVGISVIEAMVNELGYTFLISLPVLRGVPASGLIEYAAVLLMFVIALQLREIREGQRQR